MIDSVNKLYSYVNSINITTKTNRTAIAPTYKIKNIKPKKSSVKCLGQWNNLKF